MGRPLRNSADYFPHQADARHHRKVRALRQAHGPLGYAVYFMLLEHLCACDHHAAAWDETERELVAADLGVELEQLGAVVAQAVRLGLLDVTDQRLTSPGLLEALAYLHEKRARSRGAFLPPKPTAPAVSEKETPTRDEFLKQKPPAPVVSGETTHQSKVKGSKGKESKVKENKGTINPTEAEASSAGQEQVPTAHRVGGVLLPVGFEPDPFLARPEVAEAWAEYLTWRKKKGFPCTRLALEGLQRKLRELGGPDPGRWRELLLAALERGWRSIFLPRDLEPTRTTGAPGGFKKGLYDRYQDQAARLAAQAQEGGQP